MSDLISHTPIWVFVVFFALLAFGLIQTKERVVNVNSIYILPISMVIFSFFGVYSAFGITLLTVCFWAAGLALALIIGVRLVPRRSVSFSKKNNTVTIPGSWVPLTLMMAIFLTKYIVGYAIARELSVVNEFMFIATISALFGVFSGSFLSRSCVSFKG